MLTVEETVSGIRYIILYDSDGHHRVSYLLLQYIMTEYIPSHDLPLLFSSYPLWQEQTKLPAVLVQMCPHGEDVHSSISASQSQVINQVKKIRRWPTITISSISSQFIPIVTGAYKTAWSVSTCVIAWRW